MAANYAAVFDKKLSIKTRVLYNMISHGGEYGSEKV